MRTTTVSTGHRTHGEGYRKTPEYRAWVNMLSRCYTPSHDAYRWYAERGIGVCDRWRGSYESFLRDVGRRPSDAHTLERINNDGNYEPGNVRWATRKEQARNRRSSRVVVANGEAATLAEWAERTGIDAGTINRRLALGWPPERAVSAPLRGKRGDSCAA